MVGVEISGCVVVVLSGNFAAGCGALGWDLEAREFELFRLREDGVFRLNLPDGLAGVLTDESLEVGE